MSDLIQYSHRPNPKCRDEVLITVEHGYHYREVMRKCGQTATDGGRILCNKCCKSYDSEVQS